ncbi:MAG: holo-ACP synthase [Spirochaetia bacterium]|nr:holo-ACP synthase [Spirochaetia bacterium]
MIIGLGIDVVETERMIAHGEDHAFMKRFLHSNEYEEILQSTEPRHILLASRFAVKEAFGKATGRGMRGMGFSEIEVSHDQFGRPFLILHGQARRIYAEIGAQYAHVSLTHETGVAAAVVILER